MTKAEVAVKRVYAECGITDPLQLSIETIIESKNIMIREDPLEGADGRILMKGDRAVITLNSQINYAPKKRFILAHELGHFELHRHLKKGYSDNDETLNHWYQSTYANEELEANEFAAEFLMPTELFRKECERKKFDHKVIEHLASRFQVSKTAALLKFAKNGNGNHPIFLVCCQDNIMRWFKKSDDWRYYSLFSKGMPVPTGTVAHEVFQRGMANYGDEKSQQIWKSDWFVMNGDEPNTKFYEYCLYVPSLNYMISAIWEK